MKIWAKRKDFELRQFVRSALSKRIELAKEDMECFKQWEKGKWEEIDRNLKFEITINGRDSNGDDEKKTYAFNGPIQQALFDAMSAWTKKGTYPPANPSHYAVAVALSHIKVVLPDIFYARHIKEWLDRHQKDYFKHQLPEWLREKHVIVAIDRKSGKIVDAVVFGQGADIEKNEKEFCRKYPESKFKIHKGLYLNI